MASLIHPNTVQYQYLSDFHRSRINMNDTKKLNKNPSIQTDTSLKETRKNAQKPYKNT